MLNLTSLFYGLIEEGYIYEEDENGHNMSYGEYAAIEEYGWDHISNGLVGIYDKLEWLETAKEIIDSADDDAAMFFGLNEDDRYMYIDEDDPDRSEMSERMRELYNAVDFNEYAA